MGLAQRGVCGACACLLVARWRRIGCGGCGSGRSVAVGVVVVCCRAWVAVVVGRRVECGVGWLRWVSTEVLVVGGARGCTGRRVGGGGEGVGGWLDGRTRVEWRRGVAAGRSRCWCRSVWP